MVLGGFGVAKNLCNFALVGQSARLTLESIGCSSQRAQTSGIRLYLACARSVGFNEGKLTVGSDQDPAAEGLRALGAEHVACERDDVVVDDERKIVSTPAYMAETNLSALRAGLKRMVDQVVQWSNEADYGEQLSSLSGWSVTGRSLTKTWRFADDRGSIAWVNKVWSLAQEKNHHPDVQLGYNTVTIQLTTHDEGGITAADFKLAEEIESIA